MLVVPSSALATTSPAVLTVLVPLALRRGGVGRTFMAPITPGFAAGLLGAREDGGTGAARGGVGRDVQAPDPRVLGGLLSGRRAEGGPGRRLGAGPRRRGPGGLRGRPIRPRGRLGRGRGVGVRPLHGDPAPHG